MPVNIKLKLYQEKILVTGLILCMSASGYYLAEGVNHRIISGYGSFQPLETFVDAYIPLAPHFVFAYYLYYVWVLAAVPIAKTRQQFYELASTYLILMSLAILTFVIYPARIPRPTLVGDGLAIDLLRFIYTNDAGCNLLPSLHVAHSSVVAMFYLRYNHPLKYIILTGSILISMSTVFTKQHYFIDIPAGLLFAWGAFYFATDYGKKYVERLSLIAEEKFTR